MSGRFQAFLKGYLAGVFVGKLSQELKSRGFRETLRIPEPSVIEFQRGSELVTVQAGHSGASDRLLVVESEAMEVEPLVTAAARDTILEVAAELLRSLSLPESKRLEARLLELLRGPQE